ncbi:hypothetical protein [Labrys neptuniae]
MTVQGFSSRHVFPIIVEAHALADRFVAGDLTLAEFAAAPHGGARER